MPDFDAFEFLREWAQQHVRRLPGQYSTAEAVEIYRERFLAYAKERGRSADDFKDVDVNGLLETVYEREITPTKR